MAGRSYIRKVGMNGVYNESDEFMAGQRMLFRGPQDKIPAGWLIENGAAVSRTTYATLFAVIGVIYGAGDGATTFNLPDARGEFERGLDMGRGVDPGRVLGSAQGCAIQSHAHGFVRPAVNAQELTPGNMTYVGTAVTGFSGGSTTDSSGGGETRARNLAGIPIIKYS